MSEPSFKQKWNSAVSPRARAMIITTLIISSVFGIMIYRAIAHRSEQSTVAASAKVKMNVGDNDLARPVVGDEKIVPADSPIGEAVDEINKHRYETASSTGGSYIPPIQDVSTTDGAGDSAPASEPAPEAPSAPPAEQPAATSGIDDIIRAQQKQQEEYQTSRHTREADTNAAPRAEDHSEYLRLLLEKQSKISERVAGAVTAASAQSVGASMFTEGAQSNARAPLNRAPQGAPTQDGSDYVAKFQTPLANPTSNTAATQFAAVASTVPGAAEALAAAGISTDSASPSATLQAAPSMPSPSATKGVKVGRVNLGDKYFAMQEGTGNTDEPSELVFTIVHEGPLNGARLIGVPKLVGEKMTIDCSQMTLRGRDYPVKAKIIDVTTGDARLADSVDHHYVSRWGGLALAAFADGYARALSGSTTTNNGAQTTTTTTPVPDASGQMKVAIGNVGQKTTPMLQKNFERPPTVEVLGKNGVGVLFLGSFDILL